MEYYKEKNDLNSNGQWESFTGYLGPKSNKDTEKIFWSSDEPSTIGRQRGCDVISGPVSCLKPNVMINTEVDVWDLFIGDEMLTLVADKTNLRIRSTREKLSTSEKYTANRGKYTWYGETNPVELRAYFGLLYAQGIPDRIFIKQIFSSLNILISYLEQQCLRIECSFCMPIYHLIL